MASLEGLYSQDDAPQDRNFELMPKGWVEAMIEKSETKPTAKGDGERLVLTYQILDQRPEYKGRKLWHGLNMKNPNAQAVAISRGQFSSIRKAVNVPLPKDTTELHNLPHLILIGQRVNKGSGEMENVINDWKSKTAQSVPTPATGGPAPVLSQTSVPTPAAGGSAPWKR